MEWWQAGLALLVCAFTFIAYLAGAGSRHDWHIRAALEQCRVDCARKDLEIEELREINAALTRRVGQLRGALDDR